MSKIDLKPWRNPFTGQGLRLPTSRDGGEFRIYETGAMTLGDDWNHRDVCSPFWRLFYDLSEGVWVQGGSKRYRTNKTRAILLPEGVPFDCGGPAGVLHIWIHFTLSLSDQLSLRRPLEIDAGNEFQSVAEKLREVTLDGQIESARRVGMALLHLAFVGVPTQSLEVADPRMRRVLAWLDTSLDSPIGNQKLARIAGLGIEPFIRWFKKHMGQTPAVYVMGRRMREASRRLIYEEESIETIAERVGYHNRHHFSRVFQRYAGVGPGAFRKSYVNRYE